MNRIDNSGQGIASLGRDEDQYMAHVAQGEMVVPPVISQETRQRIQQEMKAAGLSPDEYTVGDGMSINPITGQPEFGWLKKTFKSIKKVAKKVAPIALAVGGGGMLSGLFGGSGILGSLFQPGAGILGGSLGPGIKSTLGNVFKSGSGMFGGNMGPSMKSGIASLFGGAGGQGAGQSKLGGIEDFLKMLGGDTGQSRTEELLAAGVTQEQIDAAKAAGKFDQLVAQARQGGSNNQGGMFSGGSGEGFGGFGGNGGLAALAALYGKATYDAAKDRQGGLSLTPEVSMDSLGRYSLAKSLGTGGTREEFGLGPAPKSLNLNMGGEARQYFNQGGLAAVAEKNIREGVDPVALQFAKGDAVDMENYINEMTNELIEYYKKDKKYKESSLLPESYIMSEEQEASAKKSKQNDPMIGMMPSYQLMKGVRRILTGESGKRISKSKIDEIKNMVRSSVKEKQMAQMGFNMGGIAEQDMREGGESEGPGTGTSDDIPAMLSDGEFVMTAAATKGAGAFNVNKTKSGIELITGGKASRKKGVENMRELMDIFEAI